MMRANMMRRRWDAIGAICVFLFILGLFLASWLQAR